MSNDVTVDPTLINQAYKTMLSNANDQLALVQAAATQLQQQVQKLTDENNELKVANQQLTEASGRQDGVPQEEPAVVTE